MGLGHVRPRLYLVPSRVAQAAGGRDDAPIVRAARVGDAGPHGHRLGDRVPLQAAGHVVRRGGGHPGAFLQAVAEPEPPVRSRTGLPRIGMCGEKTREAGEPLEREASGRSGVSPARARPTKEPGGGRVTPVRTAPRSCGGERRGVTDCHTRPRAHASRSGDRHCAGSLGQCVWPVARDPEQGRWPRPHPAPSRGAHPVSLAWSARSERRRRQAGDAANTLRIPGGGKSHVAIHLEDDPQRRCLGLWQYPGPDPAFP
ncbi:hypothetical protein M2432_002823 [Mycobacterium sp. OTB74]|nr:hypothetical protein [Mycobacterium sp. OTB74]